MGPHTFAGGEGVDVIPHPHISLATVTYLFEGELVHRDTVGSIQTIRPGAINLMIAGSGIAHSERTAPDLRAEGHTVHGLQLWLGLPEVNEEDAPSFLHYDSGEIPVSDAAGVRVRVMMGSAYGVTSPVKTLSETLYAEATLEAGDTIDLPGETDELAIYPVTGSVRWDGPATAQIVGEATLAARTASDESDAAGPGAAVSGRVTALEPCRLVIIGGEPLGTRYMWWNFVSSRTERIERAKADWRDGKFGTVVEDPDERAPLPSADSHSRMKE